MKKQITDIIRIDSSLSTPIYKQIVQSICTCIEKGKLLRNDMLPSVNSISETFSLARGSVFTAYNDLRASGIIDSIPGKGYFITSTKVHQRKKVFLLFATFTPYNAALYNAIVDHLAGDCTIDLYFHHHNIQVFRTLVNEHADHYNAFIIVPEIHADTAEILAQVNEKRLILLDCGFREFGKIYNGVYRNPETEIQTLFTRFRERSIRYKRLFLFFSTETGDSRVIAAFKKFAKSVNIQADVFQEIDEIKIKKGDGFIIYDDKALVSIVKWANERGYTPGKDVGIISYQENVLKEVVVHGITTFSTDFAAMGNSIAAMISTGDRTVVENPTIIVDRKSF